MTLRDLITDLDKPVASGSLDTEITAIAYDSRMVAPGTAFVAIRGSKLDANEFIPTALKAGASAIIAESAPPADATVPWVHVKNSRVALAQIAATFYAHPERALSIAAITGTNGKSTIAFLLHYLLNAAQVQAGLIGTMFYDLGGEQVPATHTTPESLELMSLFATMQTNGCRAVAIETSSHALHQQRTHGIPFAAAIFTNLTQDHLDYHGTMDDYFAAKTLLFQNVADAGKGQMIINADDAWGRKLIKQFEHTKRVSTYGQGYGLDFRASNVRYDMSGTTFELDARGRSFLVRIPLIGDFNVANSLAVIAAAHAMGLNLRESINHLKAAPQVPGRLERITDKERCQVFVDYAHTPDAIMSVLRTLRALKPSRIITVFGCGGDRDKLKRPLMARAAEEGSDLCVLTSDNPRTEDPQSIIADAKKGFTRAGHGEIPDRKTAIRAALELARDGDIVLIAGKGHETYQEVHGKRTPFDDRRIAKNIISQLKSTRDEDYQE